LRDGKAAYKGEVKAGGPGEDGVSEIVGEEDAVGGIEAPGVSWMVLAMLF
jgi:hypothetical protein